MALSRTKNMQVFQAGFIQRFINQQWAGSYKWFLWLNLFIFCLVYTFILVNVMLIDY